VHPVHNRQGRRPQPGQSTHAKGRLQPPRPPSVHPVHKRRNDSAPPRNPSASPRDPRIDRCSRNGLPSRPVVLGGELAVPCIRNPL